DRFVAEVLAPIPRADVASQRIRKWIDAERRMLFIEAAEKDRPDIALFQAAAANQLDRSIAEIVDAPFMVHPINFGRVQKPLHVFAETKDSRAAFGRVTTNALEHA